MSDATPLSPKSTDTVKVEEVASTTVKPVTKELTQKDRRKIVKDLSGYISEYLESKIDEWAASHKSLFRNRIEMRRHVKKTVIRDPTEPKKPQSDFMLFKEVQRNQMKAAGNTQSEPDLVKEIGARWRALTEEEKKNYRDQADAKKADYEIAVKTWRDGKELQAAELLNQTEMDTEVTEDEQ